MNFWGRLFGARERAAVPTGERVAIRLTDTIATISSRRFTGYYAQSQNKRFMIAWGGQRYFVLAGDRLVAEGRLKKPNDGKVANNGTFILNDWEKPD